MDDVFGSSAGHPSAPSSAAEPAAGSNTAFDDLDDEFEGLEDAKEGSADDDFANISRSGLDDFNPVFDSSPPQSQAAKSDSTQTNPNFGGESSFDFGSLSTGSTTGSATATATNAVASQGQAATAQGTADSHDWDAIFASLDDAPSGGVSSAAPASTSAATGSSTAKEPTRPNAPGRALTEAGDHDDPILKNLTSMGYSRADALSALEKYDYNLERVSSGHPNVNLRVRVFTNDEAGSKLLGQPVVISGRGHGFHDWNEILG